MENIWQVKQGHNAAEGKRSFQSISDEMKFNQRVVINFTKQQLKVIDSYCTINKINRNQLFRTAIVDFLDRQNFSLSPDQPGEDPRQTKMFWDMETQLKNIETGRIIFEQSCLSWMRKSVKRKKLIREIINKFVVGDFGFINEVDEMQNNFILKQNFRGSLDLTGKYPLNDNSGHISIKSKENNEYKLETRILFKPYSVIPNPKVIRTGNVIKFDFTKASK